MIEVTTILELFSTPIAVTIAWLCSVIGFFYALFQKSENTKIRTEIQVKNDSIAILQSENIELNNKVTVLNDSNNKLEIINSDLNSKVINSNNIDNSKKTNEQHGKNNINNGNINGNLNLNLSWGNYA